MKKITIIGSGALGTAIANMLLDANPKNDVLIYGIDEKELSDLSDGKNTKYFKDILPKIDITEYSNRIKQFTKEHFSIKKMQNDYEDIYLKL